MRDRFFDGPLADLVRSFFSKRDPDPWSAEIDREIRHPLATPLCLNCLFPQEGHCWFCAHCGFPTGDYVATMPYLQVFVIGETLRRGVMGPPERRKGVQLFLVLFSLSQYTLFALIYWCWMIQRADRKPICHEIRRPIFPEESASVPPETSV